MTQKSLMGDGNQKALHVHDWHARLFDLFNRQLITIKG
jgi:hypothetical protein